MSKNKTVSKSIAVVNVLDINILVKYQHKCRSNSCNSTHDLKATLQNQGK